MDQEELAAGKYLASLGETEIEFEPNGNGTTPDFELAGGVAIEVSRLTNFPDSERPNLSEEGIYKSLKQKLTEVLENHNNQDVERSFFVVTELIRPVHPKKIRKKEIARRISAFLKIENPELPYKFTLENAVSFWILDAPLINGKMFPYQGGIGLPISSALVNTYVQNIENRIVQKTLQVNQQRNEYAKWHLILVDALMWDMATEEWGKIKMRIQNLGAFEHVVVIDYYGNLLLDV